MQPFRLNRRVFPAFFVFLLLVPATLRAQAPPATTAKLAKGQPAPRPEKPPALVDPAGPTVSLQTSEALFDVAVALNACGYDNGLDSSDPIRGRVRAQVDEALGKSAAAGNARDEMCRFIGQHRLSEAGRDLAQYVSLALYLNPPPDLAPSVDQQDMPPDSTQVLDMLPLLRTFAQTTQLHLIWVANHAAYEDEVNRLHDPLSKMIVDTNTYLKLPANTYSGSRFVVVLEPMLAPSETNARIYGTDYLVVASPVNGSIHMQDVRHTYLHYEIEPLLYSRASAMDRMLPLLKTVREAPLDYVYRSDIVSLVTESLIRAIEARTMDTGVTPFEIPAGTSRADLPRFDHDRELSLQKIAAVRQQAVAHSMGEGYVLTGYFYNELGQFEHNPESLKEAIGPLVYGMDVDQQIHVAKSTRFVEEGASDIVRRPVATKLDQAEARLKVRDAEGAQKLAEQAVREHTSDPARADYILGLSWLLKNDMDSAVNDFGETVRLSQDPRLLAWSHIWLGRIHDVKEERDEAVAEYKAALTVKDSQQDTREAAEKGIAQPFELPHGPGGAAAAPGAGAADDPAQPAPKGPASL